MKNLHFIFLSVMLLGFVTGLTGCKKEGCTDPQAINFDPDANKDDGSCAYVYGCMDPAASNYNPNATRSNGSCQYRGQVTFWQSGNPPYTYTDVTVNGVTKTITTDIPGGVNGCNESGCANFSLNRGTYGFFAQEQGGGATWSGSITITSKGCLIFELQ